MKVGSSGEGELWILEAQELRMMIYKEVGIKEGIEV